MPTVRQLAAIAGVSIGTVSMALRDDPRVNAATRQRIQELAALYNYRPNRLTQGLLQGKSAVIGCLVPSVANEYASRVLRGVLQHAYEHAYRVITLETHASLDHTLLALDALTEQRVDGVVIMAGLDEPIPAQAVLMLRSHRIPPVLIDNTTAALPLDVVRSDETQLASLAVSYLQELGHHAIGFIGMKGQRQQAVVQALRAQGISTHGVITFPGPSYVQMSEKQAEALLRCCLDHTPMQTAFIAINDIVAAYLLRQATRLGITIPQRFSLLGCSNTRLNDFLLPGLTSIEQHPEEIGKAACRLLLQRVTEEDADREFTPTTLTIPAKLFPRDSCASPA
ncbi:MAG: LacI family DNA-binding transcriptional regulator [Armatimonadota bacterium]